MQWPFSHLLCSYVRLNVRLTKCDYLASQISQQRWSADVAKLFLVVYLVTVAQS